MLSRCLNIENNEVIIRRPSVDVDASARRNKLNIWPCSDLEPTTFKASSVYLSPEVYQQESKICEIPSTGF